MDINEYITTQLSGKIERRGNSPLVPALIAITGITILIMAYSSNPSEVIQTTLLTLGFILAATGLIWSILCLSKTLWHYLYLPTNSPMRNKTLYLSTEDFHYCSEMLESDNISTLKTLCPVPTSNSVLRIVYSRDRSIALLQTCRMETSQMEPSSPVVTITGDNVATIASLLR